MKKNPEAISFWPWSFPQIRISFQDGGSDVLAFAQYKLCDSVKESVPLEFFSVVDTVSSFLHDWSKAVYIPPIKSELLQLIFRKNDREKQGKINMG